ncbi:MAG TPA: ThiF family adenylyltransferase [Gemmataceae bacterium]|jgi:molybdopterin/thiamine biosynthesis adenylyltransferase
MHLFQVGVGSGGIVVLDALARDPRITRITLVEPDIYAAHNVHRHLFPESAVGRMKADVAVEWIKERRGDLAVEAIVADITDSTMMAPFTELANECDLGVCAVDNEAAKFAFDSLMRGAGKPWTLGEVLSGGIGGWIHRFNPDGPCYGCVASHLQRNVAEEQAAPPPDYANPDAPIDATRIPASKASIGTIANLHAAVTLGLLEKPETETEPAFTSLLLTLARVPGVFDDAFRTYRFRIARSEACLICSALPASVAGEDLDVALDQALARLGHE